MKRPSSPPRKYAEWTQTELELLERHFYSMTLKRLWQEYFPERTQAAVRGMAGKLGLQKYPAQREYGQPEWTAEELQLVARHYPTLKAPEIQHRFLPHRSVIAIRAAAKKHGLLAFEARAWSDEDQVTLQHYYPQGGPELVQQYLPNRTIDAIKARARAKGLRYERPLEEKPGDDWSTAELERLWQYRHLPASDLISYFPFRSRRAVINKRHELGWCSTKQWSKDELNTLREHLDASLDELCLLFPNRPRQGIYLKQKRMRRELVGAVSNPNDKKHLNALNKWTQEEIDTLRQHLDLPLKELCQLLPQRPYDGVRRKRARLRRQLINGYTNPA